MLYKNMALSSSVDPTLGVLHRILVVAENAVELELTPTGFLFLVAFGTSTIVAA